jgi:hypothetical protein
MMKILKFNSLVILVATSAWITGCNKDSGEEVSEFVGNYVISKAETAEALTLETVEMGTLSINIGQDITESIQTALLSAVNCSSASKSYVELRKNYSMYMSCEGQNELNAGTWEEVDKTTLKLNMNSAAIPTSPTGIVLTVTDIVINSTGLKGTTSVPLPKEMIAGMIDPLTLDPSTADVVNVTFNLYFIKK